MKYYVLTDPHSYFDEMIKALDDAGFFKEKEPHKLIVCGDVMDRGKQSREMEAFLYELLLQEKLIFIRGNHEDLFECLLDDLYAGDVWSIADGSSYHVSNGTWDTALQLAGMKSDYAIVMPRRLVGLAKQSIFYSKLMPAAVNYFETENYVFVHGWIPCTPKNPLKRSYKYSAYDPNPNWRDAGDEEWRMARWFNGMDFACRAGITVEGKTVVCGHYHTSYGHALRGESVGEFGPKANYSPFVADGIIALDSCVAASGMINCIVLDD